MNAEAIQYKDSCITCDDSQITIDTYYFPFGVKRIPYQGIHAALEYDMGTSIWKGRWRIWGSGDLRHWFHLDPERPQKRRAFILDVGSWVRPVLTPADPERFVAALKQHGVAVEPREPLRWT